MQIVHDLTLGDTRPVGSMHLVPDPDDWMHLVHGHVARPPAEGHNMQILHVLWC